MHIRYVQEIDFSGCTTPREFGEQLARSTAFNRLPVIHDFEDFRREVSNLLVDTDHEFDLTTEEWVEAYSVWRKRRERIVG